MQNTNLPRNEHLIMDIFWEHDDPLTGRDLKEYFPDWNYPYIVNMLTKLEAKGMIEECGTISYGTGRARKFKPAVSPVDCICAYAKTYTISDQDIAKVTIAMAKDRCSVDSELQGRLQNIIEELRTGADTNPES